MTDEAVVSMRAVLLIYFMGQQSKAGVEKALGDVEQYMGGSEEAAFDFDLMEWAAGVGKQVKIESESINKAIAEQG